ncbi:EamA family transporter [Alkalilimnicola ehrlichii]|uniref:EamA family transporter n=1 Tax=Alkalilimnicola ehrlichii TaxID=351052 RepID=A0A3E0WN75_9GAMM|nr:DMT family transporter [Alkalilimnicola ehrlichii]RFA27305.1 EamA family transporter [Alkalilimnicola ehrlichii]RFA34414.1 EamA family transporter [Alkalilimnicola ehrlichii]
MPTMDRHVKADVLLLVVTLLAAAGWVFSKEALLGMPPLLFLGLRFLLAGVVLVAFGWAALRALPRRTLLEAFAVGVLFSGAMMCWIMGLFFATHVGEGAFITSLGIVLVPVIARWVYGDTPPTSTWVALPVAVAGFGLLSLNQGFRIELGQAFFLAAAVMFAFLFNINSRVAARVPAVPLTAIQLLVVGVVALLVSAFVETWPAEVPLAVVGWLLASALLATTLRFFIQVYAQGLTTPSHAAVIMMLEPIWTALLAAVWFSEVMSWAQFGGCLLIFLALVINRWSWVRKLIKSRLLRRA